MRKHFLSFASLFIFQILFHEGTSYAWDYIHFEKWGKLSSLCDTGKRQSPIDLRATVTHADKGKRLFELVNYDAKPQKATLHNSGIFVELNNTWSDEIPSVRSSVLFPKQTYNLDNVYFHWAHDNNNGTEHSIEGKKYALEIIMCHHNNKYENLTQALGYSDGALLISILFQINDEVASNPGMSALSSHLEHVFSPNSYHSLDKFDSSLFMPNPTGSFYYYEGSIPGPLCNEGIPYIVFAEPQPITSDIKEAFRSVRLNNHATADIRPLQKTNGRTVELYVD